jgi:hypothetical protein
MALVLVANARPVSNTDEHAQRGAVFAAQGNHNNNNNKHSDRPGCNFVEYEVYSHDNSIIPLSATLSPSVAQNPPTLSLPNKQVSFIS